MRINEIVSKQALGPSDIADLHAQYAPFKNKALPAVQGHALRQQLQSLSDDNLKLLIQANIPHVSLKAQIMLDMNRYAKMRDPIISPLGSVDEGKIILSTDPNDYGAYTNNYKATGPIVNIPASQLVGFEPDDKMNQPNSKANVEKIIAGLKQGDKLPPLLVRRHKNGYQVLDGHHRFWAYKLAGVKNIPSQIVPDNDIEIKGQQGVSENFADGRGPGRPGDSKRAGIPKGASIAQLKKIRSSKTASARKKQLAHWQINMRQGRKRNK